MFCLLGFPALARGIAVASRPVPAGCRLAALRGPRVPSAALALSAGGFRPHRAAPHMGTEACSHAPSSIAAVCSEAVDALRSRRISSSAGAWDFGGSDAGSPAPGDADPIALTEREAELFDFLRDVVHTSGCGTVMRVAGGWVRDKLLGLDSDDIDIALDNLTGLAFAELISQRLEGLGEPLHLHIGVIQANPEQSKHLETVAISLKGFQIDLVNLRSEAYSDESRIPTEVEFGSALSDAQRRDLTINSLFYNLDTGRIEDMTGRGIADLRAGVIRTPLAPLETLLDDPLRVLRAVRFAARFDYRIEPALRAAMANAEVQAKLEHKISRERVLRELAAMIAGHGSAPIRALRLIHGLRLHRAVFLADVQGAGRAPAGGPAAPRSPERWAPEWWRPAKGPATPAELLETRSIQDLEALHALLLEARALGAERLPPADAAGAVGDAAMGPGLADTLRQVHADPAARRRLWVATALLCLREDPHPADECAGGARARKGQGSGHKPVTIVEEVMRHGLRGMTVQDMHAVQRMHEHAAHFAALAGGDAAYGVGASPRLVLGRAVRLAGDQWRACLITGLVASLPGLEASPSANAFRAWRLSAPTRSAVARYTGLAEAILALGLDDAWQLSPLLCGKELMARGVPKGRPVGQAMEALVDWQLEHPEASVEDARAWVADWVARHSYAEIRGDDGPACTSDGGGDQRPAVAAARPRALGSYAHAG
eukprot:CAMPEP_0206003978 /NCGR_PEP_ID=MMETSP1464-20131121/3702_1 /ASSEMBLY_ACC=CAM_ASM_001124 /TAXON_ID=119497 /ORGANISM="Exanthemachrysis gayraliae, Strain RCC1523" /LENGTH=716 /DNA_ID=CAMNT_0053377375 /DNA_START=1 /DNA_END=2152 /DNA_ORIENTATION=+